MTRVALGALAICIAAAVLEGVLAGRNVKNRLAELRQPRGSPPLPVWIGIGIGYYAICFVVLSRLFRAASSPLRGAALASVVALLIGNAVWNLTFFRLRNLETSAAILAAYAVLGVILMVLLGRVDRVSAWVFLPYLVYLTYATWWMLSLRRLNTPARPPQGLSSERPPDGR